MVQSGVLGLREKPMGGGGGERAVPSRIDVGDIDAGDNDLRPRRGDALLIVDVQNDFLPGGRLPVPRGGEVVPILNDYLRIFLSRGLPVFASRDWHPAGHCSFRSQGGCWPEHCVAGSPGAAFAWGLKFFAPVYMVFKGTAVDEEAYSAFSGTDLASRLRQLGCRRLFVGGLATDYCVLHTVQDALHQGFEVALLGDAVRAVNVLPGDGKAAIDQMLAEGAVIGSLGLVQA